MNGLQAGSFRTNAPPPWAGPKEPALRATAIRQLPQPQRDWVTAKFKPAMVIVPLRFFGLPV